MQDLYEYEYDDYACNVRYDFSVNTLYKSRYPLHCPYQRKMNDSIFWMNVFLILSCTLNSCWIILARAIINWGTEASRFHGP